MDYYYIANNNLLICLKTKQCLLGQQSQYSIVFQKMYYRHSTGKEKRNVERKKSLVLLQKELSGPVRILMAISSPRLDKPYLIYGLPKIGISMNNPGFRRFLSPFVL